MGGIVDSIFGGNDPPPAPDYAAAAKATAAGDLEAAKFATRANRINQYTPWGSQTYQELPGDRWSQTVSLTPQAQQTLDRQTALSDQYADVAQTGFNRARQTLENPTIDTSGMPGLRTINEQSFRPVRALNDQGLNDIRGIDLNALPQAAIRPGETALQAMMSRLNPTLNREDEQLRTRLANQGITPGSQAYTREIELAGQRANDLRLQAAAQGISLDQAARQQAFVEQQRLVENDATKRNTMFGERRAVSEFDLNNLASNLGLQQALSANAGDVRGRMMQEQFSLKDRPLNLINALRSGSQVASPTFNSFAQQATTRGADILGAAGKQAEADINRYNAIQANSPMRGLFGLAGTVAGLGTGGGATLGGQALGSLFGLGG